MEDKKYIKSLYDELSTTLDLGDYPKFEQSIMTDDVFRKSIFDEASTSLDLGDYNTFSEQVKKKDYTKSILGGETPLEAYGLKQKESTTPKLPYQSPKVEYDETLPENITPTSVIKSNASKGKYLEQKQTELSDKLSSDFEKEAKKLKSDYEKKLSQEGANKKQLEEEYKVRVDDLKLRKEKEASNEWDKMLDSDNYEFLAPEDVKGLGKEIDKVMSQSIPYDKKQEALDAIRDNFLTKTSILPSDIQNTLKREINEVFAKKTLFDERGNITNYGWKKEAEQKLNQVQGAKNRILSDFQKKYPDFYEQVTPTPSGGVVQGFSPSADADPTKRQQFYTDYIQYKKDKDLIGKAEEKLGNIMQTNEESASFADAFRLGGRDLLASVSSAGWSDVAKALETAQLATKVQQGEKLSEGEQALFDTYGIFDAYQQGLDGSGFKLGNTLAQSIPMIESIASLNMMGVLGGAGTATLKQIAKKEGIKKLLTKEGAKLIGKEALNLGGAMAKGAPLTPQSWVRQQQGLAGQKVLNEKGEWAIDKATVEGKVEATIKGLATGATELGSEILGGYIGEFGQVLKKIPGIKNIKLPKAVGQMAKTAGVQGAPTEITEEFINMLWQAPIGDQPLSEISLQDIWDTVWTTAGLTTILGSAAIPGGIMNTVHRNRNYDVIKTFGKDAVAQVRDAIAEKDMGKLGDAIKSAFEGKTTESLGMDVETAQRRLLSYAKSIATEVVAKDNAPESKPQETGETFTIPQIGAEPLVFNTKESLFKWLDENGEEKLPSPNGIDYLDNNVYRAMDEWKINNAQRLAQEAFAKEEEKARQLKAIEDLKAAERTDEPVGTITRLETKDGLDWYNVVNEEGQRDTFSVPEGSPQEVVQAKSEELVKPKETGGQTDAQGDRTEDQKVAEQGAPELVGQESDISGVRNNEQVEPAEKEVAQESVQKPAEFTELEQEPKIEQTESKEAISATQETGEGGASQVKEKPAETAKKAPKEETKEKSYFKRLLGAVKPSKELKEGIKKIGLTYRVLKHTETSSDIDHILSELGMEEAERAMRDLNNELPSPTRLGLALRMGYHYDRMAEEAKDAGDIEMENYYRDRAISLNAFIDERGRDMGQGNSYQGSQEFKEMLSPTTQVRNTQGEIRSNRDVQIEKNKEDLDKVRKAHKKANEDAVNELLNSEQHKKRKSAPQEGERKKIVPSERVKKEREFQSKKWQELKKAWGDLKKQKKSGSMGLAANAQEELVVQIAGEIFRSKVREGYYKVEDILAKMQKEFKKFIGDDIDIETLRGYIPKDVDGTPVEEALAANELKKATDQLVNRIDKMLKDPKAHKDNPIKQLVDTLFAKVKEKDTKEGKKADKKTAIEKIKEALENKADYAAVWEAAKKETELKIKGNKTLSDEQKVEYTNRLQGFYDEVIGKPYSEKQAEEAIRETAKDLGIELDKIIKEHYTVLDATGKTLADKIVERIELTGEQAEAFAKEIQDQFNKIATEKKRRWLENDIKAKAKRAVNQKQAKSEVERLIQLTNMGAFSDAEFAETYADAWGFPKLDEKQTKELERLAKEISKAKGFRKNEAVQDYLNYVAKIPGLDMGEVAMMIWYSNVLSGMRTQGKNALGSLSNTIAEAVVSALYNLNPKHFRPHAILYELGGLVRSIPQALTEFGYTMKTGYSPVRNNKYETANTAELWKFTGGFKNPLNYVKYYPGRFMTATDAFFYQGLKQMRAHDLAMKEAILQNRANGKPSTADWAKANEILNKTSERKAEAEKIAAEEGLTGVERKKRIYELMEEGRPQEVVAESAMFASRGTFNYKPEGSLGAVSEVIGRLTNNYGKLRLHNPYTGRTYTVRLGKLIVPFTRIIANVANTAIEYTPVGAVRAYRGSMGSNEKREAQFYREFTPEEKERLYIKAAIGTVTATLLYVLSQPGDDGEEPILMITANGSGKWGRNQETKDWQPYSIKIGGRWISYQYTPLFLVLAPIGYLRDQERFGNKTDEGLIETVLSPLLFMGSVVSDMTAIAGAAGLLKLVSSERSAPLMESFIKSQGASMVKGFFSPKFFEQGEQFYNDLKDNPQLYSSSFIGKIIKNMPVTKAITGAKFPIKYNSYGEPTPTDAFQLTELDKSDAFTDFITKNGAWIEVPKQESTTIFDQKLGIERPMNDWEFMEYVHLSGKEIKRRMIDEVMPKNLSKEDVLSERDKIRNEVRKQVKTELFGWGDFRSDEKNQKAWETLKENGAIQVPRSDIQDVAISDTELYTFTENDVRDINKKAMEYYAPETIKYINSAEGKRAKEKIVMTPNGRKLEFDLVIDKIWNGAFAQAKGELLDRVKKK